MAISKIINDGIGDVDELTVNRSGDGVGLSIERDGTERFTISVNSTDNIKIAATTGGGAGLEFFGASGTAPTILPVKEGTTIDNEVDLGRAAQRFQDLYLGGRLFIGGTGSANALDDYEEGSWTPTVAAGTVTAGNARYTKIGDLVHVTCILSSFSDRTTATNLRISGLPFTSSSSTNSVSGVLGRYANVGGDAIINWMSSSSSTLYFYTTLKGGNFSTINHNNLNNSSASFYVSHTYKA